MNDSTRVQFAKLLTDYAVAPIDVDTSQPVFSWQLEGGRRGAAQVAYQIMVASSREKIEEATYDLWDSGRVESSVSVHVVYAGRPLASDRDYVWRVRVWTIPGNLPILSPVTVFSTALLAPRDWTAQWICRDPGKTLSMPWEALDKNAIEAEKARISTSSESVLLRKTCRLRSVPKRARAFVTGLGFYEFRINGQRVGDRVLAPGTTDYNLRVLYDVYEVAGLLQSGENVLGLHLGNGWFNPLKKYWDWRMPWFGTPRALLQLHVQYEDGSEERVVTDLSWKQLSGPITESCVYDGEKYDATLECPGWDAPGFDDARWEPVQTAKSFAPALLAHRCPPNRITETILPVAVHIPAPGRFVYDLGQNISGWVRLTVRGSRGRQVTLHHAENATPEHALDPRTNGAAQSKDCFTLRGEGTDETYEPRFTYHGFQYVEVSGLPETDRPKTIEGRFVHSDCEQTGKFQCDNDLLNHLQECIVRTQKVCLKGGVPIDCAQRGERLGWLGDAHVTAEEALCNFDMALFYEKWLEDIRLQQIKIGSGDVPFLCPHPAWLEDIRLQQKTGCGVWSPAWSSGYPLLVWYHYLHIGDRRILARHLDGMKSFVDFLTGRASGHILPQDRHGDWLSVVEGWKGGEPVLTTTACYYYAALLLSHAARVLGRVDITEQYTELAQTVARAFNARYLDPQTRQYGKGTQFENAFPLFLGLVPPEHTAAVFQNLLQDIETHDGHLTTGILGTKYLIEVLTRMDRPDVAYRVITRSGYPGFEHLIRNRTTLSEIWEPDKAGSNDHVMFGSVGAWLYKTLAGINVDESRPGYEHIMVRPYVPPDMCFVHASIRTVRGLVGCGWEKQDKTLVLTVRVPIGSTATVVIPATQPDLIREGQKNVTQAEGVRALGADRGCSSFRVEAGEYRFVAPR